MKTAVILGATGLVGSELLGILLQSREYSRVIAFVRKKIDLNDEKLIQHIIDFDEIESYKQYIQGDDFFCCIGTTIKQAKTKENFIKVDYTYPVTFAEIAKNNGMVNFLLISSIGADQQSGNYYLKTKGRLEEKIKELNFPGIFIFRPSVLLGKRKEFRLGERIGGRILSLASLFLIGRMKKYKPIQSEQVAEAMYKTAQTDTKGVHIYESDEI